MGNEFVEVQKKKTSSKKKYPALAKQVTISVQSYTNNELYSYYRISNCILRINISL